MERSEIMSAMGELKLYGMKSAFDEIIATAVKRQHEPQRIVGDLLAQAHVGQGHVGFGGKTMGGHAFEQRQGGGVIEPLHRP